MKNTDFTEQWTAMQKMFLPTSAISAPLRENAPFLGKPGKGSGQHAGACECLVRPTPYRNS